MEATILKSDIFFFVTTISVIIITLGLAIGLIYLIKILHTIKRISQRAEDTANLVADDIVELRNTIKDEGFSPKRILSFFKKKTRKR